MKACLVILIVVMLSGAVTVESGKRYALSLTPLTPPPIISEELMLRCGKNRHPVVLSKAPRSCAVEALKAENAALQRNIKRLQRDLQMHRP
jgi:hypothetical protein